MTRKKQENVSEQVQKIDLTTAIAKLLSSASLRAEYSESPILVAQKIGLHSNHFPMFAALDTQQIEQQSKTLLDKRWHEVQKLIPRTVAELADEATELFMYYANQEWPEGHRRHQLDAFHFLKFLSANQILKPCGMEVQRLARMRPAPNAR